MRKTEFIFGLCAGITGLVLAALSYFSILPRSELISYSANTLSIYAVVCIAANVLGIIGALLVQKHNIPGAVIMAVAGVIFFKEHLSVVRLLGIVLSISGLILLRLAK
jgi:ABC-type Fe3+ transport system permease subunit